MDSQLPRTHGHHYEPTDLPSNPSALHSGVEGHSEGHHEKTSVMKKVKAKARKLKNSLTGHGHDHDHDHDHDHGHSHDEYEEDEDDEMVEDPEIHGAPIYESAAVKSAARVGGGQTGAEGTNLDRPPMVGPRYDSPIVDPETKPFVQWQADEEHGKHLLKEDKHAPLPCKLVDTRTGEDAYHELPHKGINTRTGRDVREEIENPDQVGGRDVMEGIRGGIGTTPLDVDPRGPDIRANPSNVQAKAIDPAGRGSEEAEGITPVIKSFNKMGISEESPKTRQGEGGGLYTGSHNQFAPETFPSQSSDYVPRSDDAVTKMFSKMGISEESPKTRQGEGGGLYTGSHNQFDPEPFPSQSSDYAPKSDNAATTLLNKMGIFEESPKTRQGEGGGLHTGSQNQFAPEPFPSQSSDYAPKSDNAATTLLNKMGIFEESPKTRQGEGGGLYTGSHNQFDPEPLSSQSSDYVPKSDNAATKLFNKMGISEEPKTRLGEEGGLHTGNHNQFAPEPFPSQSSDYVPKSDNPANPQDMPGDIYDPASKSSTYTEKFTRDIHDPTSKSSTYTEKFMSDSVPKSYDAADSQDLPEDIYDPASESSTYTDKSISDSVPKSYDAANPQDLPQDIHNPASKSSTYTEKITSASAAAASAIAGTAVSAKNVIASKIGQMREPAEGNRGVSVTGEDNKSGSATGEGNKSGSVTETATDYAHKIAATVTDTLAPVYGKVVGVGSGANSEASGLGAETTQESGGNAGQDKGVSATEYWVEKLKPGEEDKALSTMITDSFRKPKEEKTEEVPSGEDGRSISQMITDSFRKPKEEKTEEVPSGEEGRSISQVVSDAVHKRAPEESEKEKPMGKVTESEEVAKRLGTGEEGTGLENIGTGAGMVNKLTGAIGSWFGAQGGRAQSTPGTTLADDENEGATGKNAEAEGVTGEKRPRESSN